MATLNGRGQSVIEGGDVISRTPINENTEINSTWSSNVDNFLGAELTGTNSYQCILDSRIGLDEPFMIAFTKFNQNTSLSTLEILTNKGNSTIPRISLGVKKILREDESELVPGNLYNFNILEYRIAADSGNGAFILKDFSKENKIGIVTGSPHGFSTQDIVHWNGLSWELADYTVPSYKKAIGIVRVLDANSFDLYYTGVIRDLTGFTLTSGAYYASTTLVGKITQTLPTANTIHKILEVIPDGATIAPNVVISGLEIKAYYSKTESDSLFDEKLDKGVGLSVDYDTAKKIEDKIEAILPSENITQDGHIKIGSLIIQWGYHSGSLDGTSAIKTFDIPFTTSVFSITATAEGATPAGGSDYAGCHVKRNALNDFTLYGSGLNIATTGYSWYAVGI